MMGDQHAWVIGILIGALAFAPVLGAISACLICVFYQGAAAKGLKRIEEGLDRLRFAAPGPKWTFDSWATNLTAVGGVLATVLAGVTIPADAQPLGKDAFVGLSLFFGLLVVLGPFVFQGIRNPEINPDTSAGRFGWNFGLLIGCSVTGAAIAGQLMTLSLLYWELLGGGVGGGLAIALAVVVGVIAAYYFLVTVPVLVGTEWSETEKKLVQVPAGVAVYRPALVAASPSRYPSLRWSLL